MVLTVISEYGNTIHSNGIELINPCIRVSAETVNPTKLLASNQFSLAQIHLPP